MKFDDVKFLTVSKALRIHRLVLGQSGGMDGVHDLGLLESAIAQPQATFDGIPLYPSIASMAAAYTFRLVKNHAFNDGNKRSAAMLGLIFARQNTGCRYNPTPSYTQLMVAVATGELSEQDLFELFVVFMDGPIPVEP